MDTIVVFIKSAARHRLPRYGRPFLKRT
jgi:hypothetical protein